MVFIITTKKSLEGHRYFIFTTNYEEKNQLSWINYWVYWTFWKTHFLLFTIFSSDIHRSDEKKLDDNSTHQKGPVKKW